MREIISESVRKNKHSCPYKAYGEPCQCNLDWLDSL